MLTEEELAAYLEGFKKRNEGRETGQERFMGALGTGLSGIDRGIRVGGLGVGTAAAAVGAPLRAVTPEGMWFRPGDITESINAFKAFNEQRQRGDWDAGIAAYQDAMDAGKGSWALSELAGEVLLPGGLAKTGTRLVRAADKFGDWAPVVRAIGQGAQSPWRAEEAAGRAIAAPFRPVAGAIARRFRRPEDVIPEDGASPPIDEYLNQPVPDAPAARPMPGATATDTKYQDTVYNPDGSDAGWTIESVVDDMVASTDQSATPAQLQFASNNPKNMEAEFNLRLSEEGASPERVTFATAATPTPGAAAVDERMTFGMGTPSSRYQDVLEMSEEHPRLDRFVGEGVTGISTDSAVTRNVIQSAAGNPNYRVVIYRAVPENVSSIDAGDWVALDPKYAEMHLRNSTDTIISRDVPANEIAWARTSDDEWIFTPAVPKQATPTPGAVGAPVGKHVLPKNLSGARSNYNIGQRQYTPDFVSDVDKALLVVAKRGSIRDADYIKWLQEQFPGATVAQLRAAGRRTRQHIKETVTGHPEGTIKIPPSQVAGELDAQFPTRVGAPTPGAAPVTGARAAADVQQPSLGKTDTTINGETTTTYSIDGQTVDKAAYDAAETARRGSGGVPPESPPTATGAAGDGTPPPPPPRAPSGDRLYLENTGPLKQLQNIGEAIRRSTRGGLGRTLANQPVARAVFRRINPSAIDTDAKGQALIGRQILMEEGKQKADQAFSFLSSKGTQAQVFGAVDAQGRLTTGPLRGLFLNDVRSNPAKYRNRLSRSQNEWIEAADELEKSKLSLLRSNGIDVAELDFSSGGRYAGRRLLGRINQETGQIDSIGVVRNKKPGLAGETASEKHRYFDTVEDAVKDGFVYVPEDEALLFNIRDAYRRVADKRFSEWALDNIDGLKVGPTPAGVSDRAKLTQTTPDLKGAYFTGDHAEELAGEFDAMLEELLRLDKSGVLTAITKANAIGRFMTLNGDAGQFLIQLLFLANFRPQIWAKSIGAFAQSLVSTRYHSNLINNNRDLLARHPNLITSLNGTEMTEALQKGGFLTTSLGAPGRAVARTLEPFGRAFGAAMDDAGINLAKSLENRAKLADGTFDATKMADIDDFINEMRGLASSARIGVSNSQQMLESVVLLAPRYNRAIAALLYDAGRGVAELAPGVETTLRGDLGRDVLARSIAGLTSIAVAISLGSYVMKQNEDGKPLNLEDAINEAVTHINPTSPRFFTWDMNGVNIGPGTKVRTLISFAAKSADDKNSFQDVASNFARGQGAPVIGAAWDSLSGFGYMGEPTPLGVGAFGQNEYWEDYNDKALPQKALEAFQNQALPHIVPVWIQGMLMSNGTGETSVLDRVKMGAGEFVGLRTSPRNRTQLAVELAREQGLASNMEEYKNLPGLQKQRLDEILDEAIGEREYRGATGKLYEQKDNENNEYIWKLAGNEDEGYVGLENDVNKGNLAAGLGGKGFDPLSARRAFIKVRDLHNQKIVGINEKLYGEDLQEEPDPDSYQYDLWGYYQIYAGLDDITDDDEKYELIAEREGKFWADLSKDAEFDTGSVTGAERVRRILDSVRVIEGRYPKGVRNMVDAMRYASAVSIDVQGEQLAYWDLDEHASFLEEMRSLTGADTQTINEFLDRPYRAQRALGQTPGSIEESMFKAAEYSKKKGVLNRLRSQFINSAPDEWLLGMVYSGYSFPGIEKMTKQLRAQIAKGLTAPDINYKELYAMTLTSN